MPPPNHRRRGFSIVELMLVVVILALLAAIGIPSYLRARKRSQAGRILNDLRVIDQAIITWAAEKGKRAGDVATLDDIRAYMKPTDTPLYDLGLDLFGNPYGPFVVDTTPKVASGTFAALSEVAPAEFWSPYR